MRALDWIVVLVVVFLPIGLPLFLKRMRECAQLRDLDDYR